MKKSLSILALSLLAFVNAQTTTWDFTAAAPTWSAGGIAAVSGAPGQFIDSKGLGLYGIGSNGNFAAHNGTSSATWASPADAYAGTYRVQTNGGGFTSSGTEATPTQRYFFIEVDKPCVVKVWYKSGSGGAARSMIASDGATVYGKVTTNTGSTDGMPTDGQFLKANITKAGTFYLYGDTAVNVYQIQVEGATVSLAPKNTLSAVDFSQKSASKIYSSGKSIYVSNLAGKNTEVSVYSSTGSLVKTFKTSSDTNFDINTAGVYIVTLKSEAGIKSEKVLVK